MNKNKIVKYGIIYIAVGFILLASIRLFSLGQFIWQFITDSDIREMNKGYFESIVPFLFITYNIFQIILGVALLKNKVWVKYLFLIFYSIFLLLDVVCLVLALLYGEQFAINFIENIGLKYSFKKWIDVLYILHSIFIVWVLSYSIKKQKT